MRPSTKAKQASRSPTSESSTPPRTIGGFLLFVLVPAVLVSIILYPIPTATAIAGAAVAKLHARRQRAREPTPIARGLSQLDTSKAD